MFFSTYVTYTIIFILKNSPDDPKHTCTTILLLQQPHPQFQKGQVLKNNRSKLMYTNHHCDTEHQVSKSYAGIFQT